MATWEPSPISAVLLDIGGVITTPEHEMMRCALSSAGVDAPSEAMDRAHYAGMSALDWGFLTDGVLDWRRYDAAVARSVGVADEQLAVAIDALEEAWRRIRGWHRIVPGSLSGLRLLAETGVPIGVVSNADGTVADQLLSAGVCQVGSGAGVSVVVVVDSTVVGIEKPDPRIFAVALSAMGVPPSEVGQVVHVGDSIYADVDGARAAGVRPLHLDPYGDCPSPPDDHEHVRSLSDVAALVLASRSSSSDFGPAAS